MPLLTLTIISGGVLGAAALFASGDAPADPVRRRHQRAKRKRIAAAPASAAARPQALDPSAHVDEEKREVVHYIQLSVASVGFAAAGYVAAPVFLTASAALSAYCGLPVFKNAWRGFRKRKINASAVDSVAIAGSLATGYFLASGIAGLIYFLSVKLVMETEDRSKRKINNIFGEPPRSVWAVIDGAEVEVPFATVKKGDRIVLRAGDLVPIDGRVQSGVALVNQHVMTGESQPVDKQAGDRVLAGTMAIEGRVVVEVERCGEETTAAQIGQILNNTADYRASVEAKSLQAADKLALPTYVAGGVTLLTLGPVSCVALMSCNFSEILRVVTPISVLNHLKLATESGILVKDGRSMELLSEVDTVVFDKTGTLTLDQPHVGTVHAWRDSSEAEILRLAASAEHRQTHPIARAVLDAAEALGLDLSVADEARYEVGFGLRATVQGKVVHVGSLRYMAMEGVAMPLGVDALRFQEERQQAGHSLVYVGVDGRCAGALEIRATLRPEALPVIEALRARGLRLVILSGDHEHPTRHLARQLRFDEYFAETTPENKASKIEELQRQGRRVCFVGDGVNDAIALKKANVSVSIQGASTAATDTAGVVLMDQSLRALPELFNLAQALKSSIRRSVATAVVPGAVGAVGIFLFGFGIYAALLLYMASLTTGAANAMAPLLTHKPVATPEPGRQPRELRHQPALTDETGAA